MQFVSRTEFEKLIIRKDDQALAIFHLNSNETTAENLSVTKMRWKLNETALNKLLAVFSDNREEAGEKYLILYRNLVRFFELRRIAEAESAADEVINRLARKLEADEVFENINTYALGIARMLTLELSKAPQQIELPEISVPPPDENTVLQTPLRPTLAHRKRLLPDQARPGRPSARPQATRPAPRSPAQGSYTRHHDPLVSLRKRVSTEHLFLFVPEYVC